MSPQCWGLGLRGNGVVSRLGPSSLRQRRACRPEFGGIGFEAVEVSSRWASHLDTRDVVFEAAALSLRRVRHLEVEIVVFDAAASFSRWRRRS
jgi:hypothetical protein